MSNPVTESVEYGASECPGAETTGVDFVATCKVEDCGEPCVVTKKTGSDTLCNPTVYLTEEVYKTCDEPNVPLSATCFGPMSGGMGGGTVCNVEEPDITAECGPTHLLMSEASTEELTEGRKEHETEATCDYKDNRATARLTENPDLTGTYMGDLTIAVFVSIPIDCEH